MKATGYYFLPEREALDFVHHAVLNQSPGASAIGNVSATGLSPWTSEGQVTMGLRSEIHLDDPKCQTTWRRDRRMGMYHNVPDAAADNSNANSSELKGFLSRAAQDPELLSQQENIDYLATEIGCKIFAFMMKDEAGIDITLSVAHIGMDSLMAIELRRWWKQNFGLDISVLEIMGSGTLQQLGKRAAEGIWKKLVKDEAGVSEK